ncbi:MAG: hypothetical protein K1X72_20660 [Pyrinomonadaceae bacterium]|nr:hypothetical protein [Pyrinomonadaceae bacterium]
MTNFEKTYRKIVKASAIYDWIVTAPFAFPFLVNYQISTLNTLHNYFGFGGQIPNFEPMHLFFINLMGSVVLVWSTLRIHKSEPLFGFYDGIARVLFSSWMIFYLLFGNATHLLVFFVIPESIWGIVQLYGFWLYQKQSRKI